MKTLELSSTGQVLRVSLLPERVDERVDETGGRLLKAETMAIGLSINTTGPAVTVFVVTTFSDEMG